jgi:hypothetical protein
MTAKYGVIPTLIKIFEGNSLQARLARVIPTLIKTLKRKLSCEQPIFGFVVIPDPN